MPASARNISTLEIKDKFSEIVESGRNPLLSMITGVEASDDTLIIPVAGVSAQNQNMAGERLAKAITDELTRSSLGVGSCVASFNICSEASGPWVLSEARSELDVVGLTDFLRENLQLYRLKPHSVNLVTVTFGKQWSYLSIICSRESLRGRPRGELESSFKSFRQEFLDRFDIRLRLVLQPVPSERGGKQIGLEDENAAGTRGSLQRELANLIDSSPDPRPLVDRIGRLSNWSKIYLCSADPRGIRQIEDIFGEGPESNAESGIFDLRVCHPLAIKDFNSLDPARDIQPALGVNGLVGDSGELLSSSVSMVAAKNWIALDAGLATLMIDSSFEYREDLSEYYAQINSVDPRAANVLSRLKVLAQRVAETERLKGDVSFVDLATPADELGNSRVMRRAEVLVGSIMRFTQRCIMNWRDNLEDRPTIIVSRPSLRSDKSLEKILAVLDCEGAQLLDPAKNRGQAEVLIQRGRPELVKSLADVISAAYNSRETVIVGPGDLCRRGDVLPIKRRGYGYLNNLQVAAAVMGFAPISFELMSNITNPSRLRRSIAKNNSSALDREVRNRKERLLESIS
jgi:hypothetical protein